MLMCTPGWRRSTSTGLKRISNEEMLMNRVMLRTLVMGYSTPATLKKVYQHTMKDKEKEVTSTINSQMSSLFSDT